MHRYLKNESFPFASYGKMPMFFGTEMDILARNLQQPPYIYISSLLEHNLWGVKC